MLFTAVGDVWIARRAVGMSAWIWLKSVVAPIGVLSVAGLAVGAIPSVVLDPSFLRIVMTTLVTLIVFCPLVWTLVLSNDERLLLHQKAKSLIRTL